MEEDDKNKTIENHDDNPLNAENDPATLEEIKENPKKNENETMAFKQKTFFTGREDPDDPKPRSDSLPLYNKRMSLFIERSDLGIQANFPKKLLVVQRSDVGVQVSRSDFDLENRRKESESNPDKDTLFIGKRDVGVQASRDDLGLNSKPFLKNAKTLARPRGYIELDLSGKGTGKKETDDKEVEATELDIELSLAESLGIHVRKGNIFWSLVGDFTNETAEIKIKTYINKFWKLNPNWMYDIRFIQAHTNNYRKKYIFEVIFSQPTKEFPVPKATASVFFVMELPHYSCPDEVVKVHFVLEGTRFPYEAGSVEFQEDWLTSIIEDKLGIQKKMKC